MPPKGKPKAVKRKADDGDDNVGKKSKTSAAAKASDDEDILIEDTKAVSNTNKVDDDKNSRKGLSATDETSEMLPENTKESVAMSDDKKDDSNACLKIASWNINGIRAWVERDGMNFVKKENIDIFCCQETKCDKNKIPIKAEISGYHSYWHSGEKEGYSGVGLLTRIKPIKVSYGIDEKKFDNEGRVITAEYENFFLVNSYIPNASRGLTRLPFRMEWEVAFLKYLKSLDKQKPVIWCGDLNVAHQRIDIRNPDANKKSAGFTQEERDCFSKILSEGFIDSFRHLYPKVEYAYTYWSYFNNARQKNIGWRLDYFVLSERLKENLVDNIIKSEQTGSDHCPIVLKMNF